MQPGSSSNFLDKKYKKYKQPAAGAILGFMELYS